MPRKDEAPTVVSLFDELEESFIVMVVFFLLWPDIGFAGAFFPAIVSVVEFIIDRSLRLRLIFSGNDVTLRPGFAKHLKLFGRKTKSSIVSIYDPRT
jgi:hypothetical protein